MKSRKYQFLLSAGLLILFIGGLVRVGKAQVKQDSDRTNRSDIEQKKQKLKQQKQQILRRYHFDRSIHKYLTPESKRFEVPSKKEYYTPTATGKKSVSAAMRILRREWTTGFFNSRFYNILTKIAPFINNAFIFGSYRQVVPVIAPTNPYLYPQTKKGRAWDRYMQKRRKSDDKNQ